MRRVLLFTLLLTPWLGGGGRAQGTPPLPILPGVTPLPGVTLPSSLPGSGVTPAQPETDATIRPLIPDVISLRRANVSVTFDINAGNYPPAQFPTRYLSSPQTFSVFSNTSKPWTVQMEIRSQPDVQGRTLPSRQLHYRINGGPWLDVTGAPQVVLSNVGPSGGWLPLKIEFALDLTGAEAGGGYVFDVAFTAIVLP
ncbi:hypothetical protein DEIPH_ctg011orf0193 [Deinococcus phoenicis]|uniref:Uncharacterized protein n=1 Tax=Deinococcus phoenicis TaxID=1476583 RepID=A0A016QT77_9DEIO|nr:hypothetical protein [Deinococcus phoenicis]EYB69201.1 hypothetical protein DEIPH_ctg011orf0193 [Deinococcus phoenicis]